MKRVLVFVAMVGVFLGCSSARMSLDAGAVSFLRKPFRMETLAQEIRKALGV